MNKIIRLTKDIELHPKYLNSNIANNILEILKSTKICSESIGIVTEIQKIQKIQSISISQVTKFPVFRINFMANVVLPQKNVITESKITMIFQQGIFLESDHVKFLVPVSELEGYEYSELTNFFYRGDIILKVGDIINIKIIDIKYEKNSFNCIATLI